MYEFLNSSNSNEFERFVQTHENGSFMQSRLWENVKANWISEGVISRDRSGKVRGTCLVLIKKTPLIHSALMYAPRGPVCSRSDGAATSDISEGLDALAEKYRSFAFICDPQIVLTENSPLVDLGTQTKGREVQARIPKPYKQGYTARRLLRGATRRERFERAERLLRADDTNGQARWFSDTLLGIFREIYKRPRRTRELVYVLCRYQRKDPAFGRDNRKLRRTLQLCLRRIKRQSSRALPELLNAANNDRRCHRTPLPRL